MQHPRAQLPSRDAFSAAVTTSFDVSAGDHPPVEFTLVECNTLLDSETQETYSLLFRGPSGLPPVQGIYALENEKLGKLELFLVPIKRDEQGLYFEAIMNHLLSR
ncbi:MAG TPA: hypothetical protein VJ781_03375 [Pyrinomonadaceae bacterium]|nr:hypothetical protein [Pyrinomonadaceae bacterium]